MIERQKVQYDKSAAFLWRAALGYAAYYLFFPMWLPSLLNKIRGVKIGDYRKTYIAPNVLIDSIYPELVTIEEETYLTRGCKIISHFNPTDPLAKILGYSTLKKAVRIGHGTFVGVNAVILPGVDIGRCCIVAAGAVVTKSFPDYSVIAGNPAKQISDVRQMSIDPPV